MKLYDWDRRALERGLFVLRETQDSVAVQMQRLAELVRNPLSPRPEDRDASR